MPGGQRRDDGRLRDLGQEMVDDTSKFLTWALSANRGLARIPIRRVDNGGFELMIRVPGVKKLVRRWWDRALEKAWPDQW